MQRCLPFAIALMFLTATFVEAGHKRRHRDSSTSFQVRLGGFFPEGESNFWADNESIFTLNASDFDDGAIGATFSRAYGNHLEMDFNIDHYNGTTVSEYRNFVDAAGFPILHDTERLVGFLPRG